MKLLVAEEDSARVRALVSASAEVATVDLTEVEARAAIARRLRGPAASSARRALAARWAALDVIAIDATLVRTAGAVAERYRLRALDAVHLAAARRVARHDFALVTWDAELRRAAIEAGLAVAPA